MTSNESYFKSLNIGDRAQCVHGRIGRIEKIVERNGRKLAIGKTDEGGNWQSVYPVKVN